MNHQHGVDPTPQGREPKRVRQATQSPPEGDQSEKYEKSAPGPAVREDGAYFFGYKRENAYQSAERPNETE